MLNHCFYLKRTFFSIMRRFRKENKDNFDIKSVLKQSISNS